MEEERICICICIYIFMSVCIYACVCVYRGIIEGEGMDTVRLIQSTFRDWEIKDRSCVFGSSLTLPLIVGTNKHSLYIYF